MDRFLLVFVAGGLGSVLRYLVGLGAGWLLGTAFPYATLLVNLLGSLAMGGAAELTLTSSALTPAWRLALMTGLLGGFTTYSSFNQETTALAGRGAFGLAALNVALTLAGCLLAGLGGAWLVRRLIA